MDTYESIEDADLLRIAKREPEAFGAFYDRHAETILAYCMRRVGCAETAADITAEVFAAAYVQRSKFRNVGKPAVAWLYGIARRQIGTFARKERVSAKYLHRLGMTTPMVTPSEVDRIDALVDLEPLRSVLAESVAALPAGQADALHLRVVQELPYAEVAVALGCSEGAARVRVARGLSSLADSMEVPV